MGASDVIGWNRQEYVTWVKIQTNDGIRKGEGMEQYVIYLSTCNGGIDGNSYGYWTGKDYTVQGAKYPVTKDEKGLHVKMYHNKKVAENALKRCIDRYEHVRSGRVEVVTIGVHIGN